TADNEPLGLSVLESLAMGRPVIAFRQGGIPEVVEDQVTGWLVAEPTAVALAAAVGRAQGDRPALARMGEAARRFVVEHCSIEAMCRGYAAVYDALARPS
ncbi:MAG TPA: glycosyltransferase family 4 protein, partial [Polyangiaceae bacterium]|nr:glycosyltransferase family 4 protein [Polyangiaceae bacterium]